MDQNNPSITGVAQFPVVRYPLPIPQNSLNFAKRAYFSGFGRFITLSRRKIKPNVPGTFLRFSYMLNRLAQVSGSNSRWLWKNKYLDFSKNLGSDCFGGLAGGPGPLKVGQRLLWRGYFGPFMS